MNKKEKELFLALCNFKSPDRNKIESLLKSGYATSSVLGMLFDNRMAATAYGVLSNTSLIQSTGREFRNSLKNAALINTELNKSYFLCLRYISSLLDICNVPYALLKGALLCPLFPKGYRTSNDIDVLICPENTGKISAILKKEGFEQGKLVNGIFVSADRAEIIRSKMTRGETVPFIKEVNLPFLKHLEIDLNFSLDYKNGDGKAVRSMLSRSVDRRIGDLKIRTLEQNDFILHLCAHLYKEATTLPWVLMKRDMTLYKYCDIYSLLSDLDKSEQTSLISAACEQGLDRELAYCLRGVHSFWGISSDILRDYVKKSSFFGDDLVFAPAEKRVYRYIESDPAKRFFMSDRTRNLEEVKQ